MKIVNYPKLNGATPIEGARKNGVAYDLAPGEAIEVTEEVAMWLKATYPFLEVVDASKKQVEAAQKQLDKAKTVMSKDLRKGLVSALTKYRVGPKEIESLVTAKISAEALVDMDEAAIEIIPGIGDKTVDKILDYKSEQLMKRQEASDKSTEEAPAEKPVAKKVVTKKAAAKKAPVKAKTSKKAETPAEETPTEEAPATEESK